MKRIAAVIIVLGIMLGVAPPSQAYTHLGATNNVALAIQWRQALLPEGSPFAILVRSDSFADSLAAGARAGVIGAPVLMNSPGGGLDDRVENELGLTVERIAGENRFETAARTADRSFNGTPGDIVAMVEGLNANSWASGYPASVSSGGAVVLADGDTLPDATASFLSSQPGDELYCAPEVSHTACLAADGLLDGG